MTLDSESCYSALCARDARFDGRFFVAVRTTGVYCRPICTVKTPKRQNCSFYGSAAAAEASGYRPCLRCRPELAPGNASVDASSRLARAVADRILQGWLEDSDLTKIASALQITDRHVRRAFRAHFGVSPIAYAQTQRLLMAKRLLSDTRLTVTQVAFASGFGSLRRFNTVFKQRYHVSPSKVRNGSKEHSPQSTCDAITCLLSFRSPYDWNSLLAFISAHSVEGVEEVSAGVYRRAIRIEKAGKSLSGWIVVSLDAPHRSLKVLVSSSLLGALGFILSRVQYLMDLAANPHEIAAVLGPIASRRPGLRVPGAFDGFEVGVRAILGQRFPEKTARTIAGRFAESFGASVDTPFAGVSKLFPRVVDVVGLDTKSIASLGLGSCARTIVALARAIARDEISLQPNVDIPMTLDCLRALPGIEEWTAQYIVMRATGWPDAFPYVGLSTRKAPSEGDCRRMLSEAEAWRPWRAYAAMHFWRSAASIE